MKILPDLHPDDTTTRQRLRRQLNTAKTATGLSQKAAARIIGRTQTAVHSIHHGDNWQTRNIARLARAYNHRLHLAITGLQVPDDGDTLAAVYDAQTPATGEAEDLLLIRRTVNDLARIRRHTMTAAYAATRLGATEGAVFWFETHPDGVHVAVLQRFTRALGGRLDISLRSVRTLAGVA